MNFPNLQFDNYFLTHLFFCIIILAPAFQPQPVYQPQPSYQPAPAYQPGTLSLFEIF